jgi:hypothetical protein
MIKPHQSKQAAIRYAVATYGDHWPEHARFLEVKLPESETLYMIQPRSALKPASPHIEEPISEPITEQGAIKRMHAIFSLMRRAYPKATRKDLLDECVRQGLRRSTAATQYNIWRLSTLAPDSALKARTH